MNKVRFLTKIAMAASVFAALTFTASCSDNGESGGYSEKGNDIAKYKTVEIGEQVWMAENLDYEHGNSWCYKKDPAYCKKYGRLYDWETAKTVCPSGWHLPSKEELEALVDYAGGKETAGTKLKSANGWDSGDNGTDDYGFSALPGGLRSSFGSSEFAGGSGSWWSSTELNDTFAYRLLIYRSDRSGEAEDIVIIEEIGKRFGFSVRCLKD